MTKWFSETQKDFLFIFFDLQPLLIKMTYQLTTYWSFSLSRLNKFEIAIFSTKNCSILAYCSLYLVLHINENCFARNLTLPEYHKVSFNNSLLLRSNEHSSSTITTVHKPQIRRIIFAFFHSSLFFPKKAATISAFFKCA